MKSIEIESCPSLIEYLPRAGLFLIATYELRKSDAENCSNEKTDFQTDSQISNDSPSPDDPRSGSLLLLTSSGSLVDRFECKSGCFDIVMLNQTLEHDVDHFFIAHSNGLLSYYEVNLNTTLNHYEISMKSEFETGSEMLTSVEIVIFDDFKCLIAVGDSSGHLKLFQYNLKTHLYQLMACCEFSDQPIWCMRHHRDLLFFGSDDACLRVVDISKFKARLLEVESNKKNENEGENKNDGFAVKCIRDFQSGVTSLQVIDSQDTSNNSEKDAPSFYLVVGSYDEYLRVFRFTEKQMNLSINEDTNENTNEDTNDANQENESSLTSLQMEKLSRLHIEGSGIWKIRNFNCKLNCDLNCEANSISTKLVIAGMYSGFHIVEFNDGKLDLIKSIDTFDGDIRSDLIYAAVSDNKVIFVASFYGKKVFLFEAGEFL